MTALLEVEGLVKSYAGPAGPVRVLDVPRLVLKEGEELGLAGGSGSGKTTLLHVVAGLVRPDAGSVVLAGRDMARLPEAERDRHRALVLGYVFQSFHLLPAFSALENVVLGMSFGPGPDPAYARDLLARLGLGDRMHHRPGALSVGQRQRVALARALANHPRLVLADEPTGSLDPDARKEALALLSEVCRERGAALLCVSHDPEVLASLPRRVDLAELNRAGRSA